MAEKKGRIPVKKVAGRRKREPEKPSALAPKVDGAPRQMNLPTPPRSERPPINVARPPVAREPEDSIVPEGIVLELASARGWILFAAVLQFIAATGVFLTMAWLGFLAYMAGRGDGSQPFTVNRAFYAGLGGVIGAFIVFLVFLGLGLRMTGFAASVRALAVTSEGEDLEAALIYMRRFWQLIGASFLVPILGVPLVFLFSKLLG